MLIVERHHVRHAVAISIEEHSSFSYAFVIALNIKDPETDRLARALAAATGESITEAVAVAVRERLERIEGRRGVDLVAEINAIVERCAALPRLDDRSADEILGYDEFGVPS